MFADRDFVVLAHQNMQNINIVFARLRPVDKEACPCALTQSVIHIFGIVRKHAKGAIAAHNGIRTGKALHQNGGNLELSGGALAVAAFAGELVNIINRTKANNIGINHIIEKGLGILRGFALIAINAFRGEVLITKRISRILAIIMYQPRHHSPDISRCGCRQFHSAF